MVSTGGAADPGPMRPVAREPLASAPHGQGRRHRCGTTGVRALVVDEQARVVDVAYRELTQYFPRPGWVEHDPAEIWDAVRSTLAEVGDRLARPATPWRPSASPTSARPLVAWDRSTGRPLHRAIVWQDRRTTALCAELTDAGHLPLVRETTGLVLDPYFSATKAAGCCGPGRSRSRPATRPRVRHRRHLGAVEPDRRAVAAVCTPPTPPTPAGTLLLDIVDPGLVRRAVRALRRAGARPARRAPVVRALRAGRRRRPRARLAAARRRPRQRASPATSRPPSSGRPASIPAWSRSPTAPAASSLANAGPSARPRPTA